MGHITQSVAARLRIEAPTTSVDRTNWLASRCRVEQEGHIERALLGGALKKFLRPYFESVRLRFVVLSESQVLGRLGGRDLILDQCPLSAFVQ